MSSSRLAFVLLALSACGGSYTLDEAEGVAITRDVFERRDIFTGSTRPLGPIRIDELSLDLSFTVDAWSLADKVGFEYVSEGDPDFAAAPVELGGLDEWPKLQAAVDVALEEEPGVRVLILRTWSHETAGLAQGQLEGYVDAWLTEHGY